MTRTRDAAGAPLPYAPAEAQFNRRRATAGLIIGPTLFIALLLIPAELPPAAQKLAAAMSLMIVLWITEALPLAVTALVGPMLAVLLGVAPASTVFAPFADPIIFLFIGSFILAEAMFVHRLDRRMAFAALASAWIGRSGFRLILVYAVVTATVSAWMSNTATTAMMFPLALAVVGEIGRGRQNDAVFRRFAMAMMLVTSYAASIGGMATPVGTPPNLIGKSFLLQSGIDLSFAAWMLLCIPIVLVVMGFIAFWMIWPAARGVQIDDHARDAVRRELRTLGPFSAGERNVVVAFSITVALWMIPGLAQAILGSTHPFVSRLNALVPESIAALLGAVLLFLLPVNWRARQFTITWEHAARIDWGIVLLFGGGLAMGRLADSTGLSAALGHWVTAQFPDVGTVGLTMVFTAMAILLSEAASNTAAANIIIPMAIAVSKAAGISPFEPALGATLGASMGFMMPISTPPNAIVYSSGHIPIGAMIRHGFALDVAGFVVIVIAVLAAGSLMT
jgi:sodium-dependent dicarboxylate transporter 2/3/5